MLTYITRRILICIPLLFLMATVSFFVMQLPPGCPLDPIRLDPRISEELIQTIERQFGLDKPLYLQYLHWMRNALRLDFGWSMRFHQPVWDIIKERVLATLLLSLSATLCTWLIAIPLGTYAAVNEYKWKDRVISILSAVGLAVPNFFLAILLIYIAHITGVLPLGGMRSLNHFELSLGGRILDIARHLVIPTVVLGTAGLAGMQRIMRGNLLEVLRTQYIATARAKGLSENRVLYFHALRNAINPLVTMLGFSFSALLSGAALTEMITAWPGLGLVMLQAVRMMDQFLLMAAFLMSGVMLILGNLLADILLVTVDPRIRYD
jgi:peptide/nickel transport system permease protein